MHFLKTYLCYAYVTRILLVRKSAATCQLSAEDFCLGSTKKMNELTIIITCYGSRALISPNMQSNDAINGYTLI